ncbi:MAG TPA: DUF167 domain-containing protein [Candidatus Paceibacterota bacterium]
MYISVRVVAGAKVEKVEELPKGRLKISVKVPARQNLANRRVRELVAAHLGLPLARVRLLSGHTSPSKIFSVDD